MACTAALCSVVWAATVTFRSVNVSTATPPFVPWVYAPHFTLAMGHPVNGTEQVTEPCFINTDSLLGHLALPTAVILLGMPVME